MMAENSKRKLNLFIQFQSGLIERRDFLKQLAVLSGMAMVPFSACRTVKNEQIQDIFTAKNRNILIAVQEHLFPKMEDSPGASELNAANYLQNNILPDKNGDPEEQEFIKTGPGRLETACYRELGKSFLKLDSDEKEKMLQHIHEYVWGERWLALLLLYIFEALLADPLYGGNAENSGWTWLEHRPGYPRPKENQIYRITPYGS